MLQILAWVEECVTRLQAITAEIVVTDLPVESLRRLSAPAFLAFRSILYPRCRLSLAEVLASSERVSQGLLALAGRRGVRAVHLAREWYGFDPIHIRAACWGSAWRQILHGEPGAPPRGGETSLREKVRLYAMRPERERILGFERVTRQAGAPLAGGGRVWLF